MFEKSYCRYQNILDPPKSPLKKGDFDSSSHLFNELWGFKSPARQAARFVSGSKSPSQNVIANCELRIANCELRIGLRGDLKVPKVRVKYLFIHPLSSLDYLHGHEKSPRRGLMKLSAWSRHLVKLNMHHLEPL
jgi:hypothetical protein